MKLKVDLVRELEETSVQQEAVVKQAQRLLSAAHDQDEAVVSTLGIDVNRRVRDKTLEEQAVRRHASALPNTSAIGRDDLLRVGAKYRLKVRPVSEYSGPIPPDLGAAVNRFVKEAGIPSLEHSKSRFFVLAPPHMFAAKDAAEVNREFPTAPRGRAARHPDPVLLYSKDMQHFDFVHKWGDDFTAWRRALGVLHSARFQAWSALLASVAVIALMIALPPAFPVIEHDPASCPGTRIAVGLVAAWAIGRLFLAEAKDLEASDVSRYSEAVFIPRSRSWSLLRGFYATGRIGALHEAQLWSLHLRS